MTVVLQKMEKRKHVKTGEFIYLYKVVISYSTLSTCGLAEELAGGQSTGVKPVTSSCGNVS